MASLRQVEDPATATWQLVEGSAKGLKNAKQVMKRGCFDKVQAAQACLPFAFRQKHNEHGRQECLPHLHKRFLNGSKSHSVAVELIDPRITLLTVTIA